MSAEKHGNHFAHFTPLGTTPLATITVSSAAASNGEYVCARQCYVTKVQAVVQTTVVGSSTAPTIVFSKRPTVGSASSATVIGTLTIPTTTAPGKVVYKLVTPVLLQPGQSVEIAWTQAVGSAAGVVIPSFTCQDSPETDTANSNEIASA